MKKLLPILLAFCFSLSVVGETVFEFASAGAVTQSKDGFTVKLEQGNNASNGPVYKPETQYYEAEMRLYLDNTITVSGNGLTNVQLVCAKSSSGKKYADLTVSTGEITSGGASTDAKDYKVDTWKGNAKKVVFTLSGQGQRKLQKIIINGDAVVIEPEEPEPLPTEADLDQAFVYSEPSVVNVPDTQIFKNEYAFIANNILVHCSKGSILREDKTAGQEYPAYFNCNENEEISFTATKPIERIEIDGFLRKAFTATCDKGTMQSKANEDFDVELDNVLTISGIKANKVTIHCNKQLRCFEVRAFFKEQEEEIDQVPRDQVPSTKVIENGVMYLMYKGTGQGDKVTKYNVQGGRIAN